MPYARFVHSEASAGLVWLSNASSRIGYTAAAATGIRGPRGSGQFGSVRSGSIHRLSASFSTLLMRQNLLKSAFHTNSLTDSLAEFAHRLKWRPADHRACASFGELPCHRRDTWHLPTAAQPEFANENFFLLSIAMRIARQSRRTCLAMLARFCMRSPSDCHTRGRRPAHRVQCSSACCHTEDVRLSRGRAAAFIERSRGRVIARLYL